MFKVEGEKVRNKYDIRSTKKNNFRYHRNVIIKPSKSATAFDRVEKFTKTELIKLFADISVNDVWSAQYQTFAIHIDIRKPFFLNLCDNAPKQAY